MDADGTGTDFAAELARLKRRGSAVLVRDGGDGLGVCTDLLGSDAEERRRVLARSTGGAVLPVPPAGATVVEVTRTDARSVAAASPAEALNPGTVARHVEGPDGIDALVDAVLEAVESRSAGGVEPGELRVCLGRLDGFVEREPADAVAAAVGELWDAVRGHAGMGHAHVSADPPAAVERTFDVTVETRTTPAGLHESRWRVHAAGLDTGWIPAHER